MWHMIHETRGFCWFTRKFAKYTILSEESRPRNKNPKRRHHDPILGDSNGARQAVIPPTAGGGLQTHSINRILRIGIDVHATSVTPGVTTKIWGRRWRTRNRRILWKHYWANWLFRLRYSGWIGSSSPAPHKAPQRQLRQQALHGRKLITAGQYQLQYSLCRSLHKLFSSWNSKKYLNLRK